MLLLESAIPQACLSVGVCMSAQLCLTLHDPLDSSPPGSSVHRILQVRTLEWIAVSSSTGSSPPRDQTLISCISCIGRRILYHWATREAIYRWLGVLSSLVTGLNGEEHAGLFSIPRVPSSARLSSELGTREEEKMTATKSLYCWTPVNPLSLSSGDCREWHSLFVMYCVFSVYWVTSPREPTDFLVHVNAPPSAGPWIDTWWHVQLPSETCCHPQMSPLRQSLVVDPEETLFHFICLLTTPTGQVAVFPFEES